MLPFLAVVGGAAAVEIKNQITGDRNVNNLQRKQRELEALVKEVQSQLEEERARAQDLVVEKTKMQLEQQKLQEQAVKLEQEKKLLLVSTAVLHQKEQELGKRNEELQTETKLLNQQMEELRVESGSRQRLLEDLRSQVAEALEQFAKGIMTSEGVLVKLQELGVEVHCQDGLPQLTVQVPNEHSNADSQVGLPLSETWKHKLRLVFDSPDRAAKLIRAASMDPNSMPSSPESTPRIDFGMRTSSLSSGASGGPPFRLSSLSRLAGVNEAAPTDKENMVPMLAEAARSSPAPANSSMQEDTSPFVKFVDAPQADAASPALVFAPQQKTKDNSVASLVPKLSFKLSNNKENTVAVGTGMSKVHPIMASATSKDIVLQ